LKPLLFLALDGAGEALTDENFRERFFENPEGASCEAGLALSPIELEELSRVPRAALVSLHDELEDPALYLAESDRPLRGAGAQCDGAGAGLEVVYLPLCGWCSSPRCSWGSALGGSGGS
jgi:hypothetical protein